jgi:hypothetical protein
MKSVKKEELLQDDEVMKEIQRHRWLESEKKGEDIGFEAAAEDWLNSFSNAWLKCNSVSPKKVKKSAKRI